MKKEKGLYQVSLKAFIKNDQGEILILEAVKDGSHSGFYDFPGGRIDTDELTDSFVDVVKREVLEEIGNVVFTLNPKPVAIGRHLIPASVSKRDHDVQILCVFFEAEYLSGEIKISSEHLSFKWVDFSKEDPARLFNSGNLEGLKMYLL